MAAAAAAAAGTAAVRRVLLVAAALLGGLSPGLRWPGTPAAPSFASASSSGGPPLLLAEASLRALGAAAAEMRPPDPLADGDGGGGRGGALLDACEKTHAALFKEAPPPPAAGGGPAAAAAGSALLGGPVYRECVAALAAADPGPSSGSGGRGRGGPRQDALGALRDCEALVDGIVERLASGAAGDAKSLCLDVISAGGGGARAAPSAGGVQGGQVRASAPTEQDLQAVTAVCLETVRDVEAGLRSDGDAARLAGVVAPICEKRAAMRLKVTALATGRATDAAADAAAAAAAAARVWCQQLDGRLSLALETGFFFAAHPREAERRLGGPNPFASTTRRQFCARFAASVSSRRFPAAPAEEEEDAAGAGPAAGPAAAGPPAAEPGAARPQEIERRRTALLPPPLQPTPPPPPASPRGAERAPPHPSPAPQPPRAPPPPPPPPAVTTGAAPGVDILALLQALSARREWAGACRGLVSRLTSEEGSITEEYALGYNETARGSKVLTFNEDDQAGIARCAAQLKVVAIQAGAVDAGGGGGGARGDVALALSQPGVLEGLVDSPWAHDACTDIAHGFLTAHLAHPDMKVSEFCPMYAADLQAMRAGRPSPRGKEAAAVYPPSATEELKRFRSRGAGQALRRHEAARLASRQARPAAQPTTAPPLAATRVVGSTPTATAPPPAAAAAAVTAAPGGSEPAPVAQAEAKPQARAPPAAAAATASAFPAAVGGGAGAAVAAQQPAAEPRARAPPAAAATAASASAAAAGGSAGAAVAAQEPTAEPQAAPADAGDEEGLNFWRGILQA